MPAAHLHSRPVLRIRHGLIVIVALDGWKCLRKQIWLWTSCQPSIQDPDIYQETITSALQAKVQLVRSKKWFCNQPSHCRGGLFVATRKKSLELGTWPIVVQLSSWPRNCVQMPLSSALSSRDLGKCESQRVKVIHGNKEGTSAKSARKDSEYLTM